MKIAVVGAGLFGCSIALRLSQIKGLSVSLIDHRSRILCGASGHNHFRIHNGYHYPRCEVTARACRDSFGEFIQRFRPAVVDVEHYYAVDPSGIISPQGFEAFMDGLRLPWHRERRREARLPLYRVAEAALDVERLRKLLETELSASKVVLRLGERYPDGRSYEHVVFATYETTNAHLRKWFNLVYEIVEKPIVSTGLNGAYIVVDGDFACLTPGFGGHILGGARTSIHWKGSSLDDSPKELACLSNRGVRKWPITRYPEIKRRADQFFVAESWRYQGSFFTTRAVLEGENASRPSVIRTEGANTAVLGGKLVESTTVAEKVAGLVTAGQAETEGLVLA